jgi:hypothetical protein
MNRPHRWIAPAALAAAVALAGCATPAAPVPPAKPLAQVVGRVARVDAAGGYVLVQILGSWEVPDMALLHVRSLPDRIATLRPTGERQGRYAAADIVSGTPEVGDAVIHLPEEQPVPTDGPTPPGQPAPTPAPTTVAPTTPATPEDAPAGETIGEG